MNAPFARFLARIHRGFSSRPFADHRGPRSRRWTRPQLELLEDRVTPAITSYDVYALTIINEMRADPAAFGQELANLYANPNYVAPDGMSGNSPAWQQLRVGINTAQQLGTWQSGFASGGAGTFLNTISSLPPSRPLVLEGPVEGIDYQGGAEGHAAWMYTNGYLAHSVFGSQPLDLSAPLSGLGLTPVPNPAPDHMPTTDMAEIIAAGVVPSFVSGGTITNTVPVQQSVYDDILGYILDYSNFDIRTNPYGHLLALAAQDPLTPGPGPAYNVMGLAESQYTNSQGFPLLLSTGRLGLVSDESFIAGVVYNDNNNNGWYDPGEGVSGQVTINFPVVNSGGRQIGGPEIVPIQGNTGYFVAQVPSALWGQQATITANLGGQHALTWHVTLDQGNRFYQFRLSPGDGVTTLGSSGTTPVIAPDLFEPNNTPQTATNLGAVGPANPVLTQVQALTVDTPSDQDWFKFQLAGQTGANYTIFVGTDAAGGGVQAQLYSQDAAGQLHPASAPVSRDAAGLVISLTGLPAGTYYLNVSGVGGDTTFYSLQFADTTPRPTYVPPGGLGGPSLPQLDIMPLLFQDVQAMLNQFLSGSPNFGLIEQEINLFITLLEADFLSLFNLPTASLLQQARDQAFSLAATPGSGITIV
jgi:hypothetical protein